MSHRFVGLLMAGICTGAVSLSAAEPTKITYQDHVLPVFRRHCLGCHNPDKRRGDLNLSAYQDVLSGGSSGEAVKAGNAGTSALYRAVAHLGGPKMPPNDSRIPDDELALIRDWINGGLLETSGSAAKTAAPTNDLALSAPAIGRPEGPPPMPGKLPEAPVVHAARANSVTALAASPWAPLAAVGGLNQILLYNTDTQALLGVLPFPEKNPAVLKFSRNGKLLLAAGGRGAETGRVVLFDVTTGRRVAEIGDEYDTILAADISSDHKYVALGGPSKLVKIYTVADGKLLHSIKRHTDWVTALEFSPDGLLVATGDRVGNMYVWEVSSGGIVYSLDPHVGAVNDLTWRLDSNVLATASEDDTVILWDMTTGEKATSFSAHGRKGVRSIEFTHDGRLVTAGRDNRVKIWDKGRMLKELPALEDIALSAVFSHDGQQVIAGEFTGQVFVWKAADGTEVGRLSANP